MGGMKTFVVRLFVPAEHEPRPAAMQGFVEDVTSGRRSSFADDRELLAFLGQPDRDQAREQPERSLS